jgi:putative acetyltransferase
MMGERLGEEETLKTPSRRSKALSIDSGYDINLGMQTDVEIRESQSTDIDALVEMYPKVFPEEDLVPVLRDLLAAEQDVFSLVAVQDGNVIGHVGFSICGVDGQSGHVGMIAPLAVQPDQQRKGIGSALVQQGFMRLESMGIDHAYVLGDPAYYGRFGFKSGGSVVPPYKLPDEWEQAWQSVSFSDNAPTMNGKIKVPAFWQHPHLWLP